MYLHRIIWTLSLLTSIPSKSDGINTRSWACESLFDSSLCAYRWLRDSYDGLISAKEYLNHLCCSEEYRYIKVLLLQVGVVLNNPEWLSLVPVNSALSITINLYIDLSAWQSNRLYGSKNSWDGSHMMRRWLFRLWMKNLYSLRQKTIIWSVGAISKLIRIQWGTRDAIIRILINIKMVSLPCTEGWRTEWWDSLTIR